MLLLYPLLASLLAAVVCGAMGPLTLLRRNTYAAGAISHTCLAGLGLAQYLQVACGLAWISPMTGALAAAVLAALYLAGRRAPPLQGGGAASGSDAALSAVWAVGMAVGLAFLSATPGYQGDLMGYLFGSILLVSPADLAVMGFFALLVPAVLALFWRGILSISFNAEATALRGAPAALYERVLAVLTALAVVLLVRAVGIVLVIALLTLPALTARSLCRRIVPMMALTGLLTFLCLCGGLAFAWVLDTQPSAPTVLLAAALAAAARLLTTRNAPSAR